MARVPAAAVRHRAKLVARSAPTGPKPAWYLPWSLHRFVGPPKYPRPPFPGHITTRDYGWVLDEWARYSSWQERRAAHIAKPALGLWPYGRVPDWAWRVAEAYAAAHPAQPVPVQPPAPTPAPTSPNTLLVQRAQRVIFTAWRPGDGLAARGGRVSFSADMGLGGDHLALAKAACAIARDQGKDPSAWANQSQVGVSWLPEFGRQIGAKYVIWQGETIGEMIDVGIRDDGVIVPGSPIATGEIVLVGNPNAWTPKQRETAIRLYIEGRFALIFETYTNEGSPWPDASGAAGVPASSICPGVGWGRYPHQLGAYKLHTPPAEWPTISPYLAEDFDSTSWAVLPF